MPCLVPLDRGEGALLLELLLHLLHFGRHSLVVNSEDTLAVKLAKLLRAIDCLLVLAGAVTTAAN